MRLQLVYEFDTDDWRDATTEMFIGEMCAEHPDETSRKLMDDWGLDHFLAALTLLTTGQEVSSRRGGRFKLVVRDEP